MIKQGQLLQIVDWRQSPRFKAQMSVLSEMSHYSFKLLWKAVEAVFEPRFLVHKYFTLTREQTSNRNTTAAACLARSNQTANLIFPQR